MSSPSSAPGIAAICMSEERAMALAAALTLTGPTTIPSNANAKRRRRRTTMAIMAHKLAYTDVDWKAVTESCDGPPHSQQATAAAAAAI